MGINVHLTNGAGKEAHNYDRDDEVGLLVYSKDRFIRRFSATAALNPDFGNALNQNVSFTGTPQGIHDGTDTAYWTGSNVSGSPVDDFSSTDRANSGAQSVKIRNHSVGDIFQFAKGSDVNVSDYTAFTFAINVDRRWEAGDSVSFYCWDTGTGTIVGNKVFVEDFISFDEFDVWQNAIIPFTAMGLPNTATFDAVRFELEAAQGTAPNYYLDDIQIEESGGSEDFIIQAFETDRYFFINEVVVSITDNIAATVTNGTALGLSHDALLGLSSLSNGINLTVNLDGGVLFSATIKTLGDFLSTGFALQSAISDGTNTMITLRSALIEPIRLDPRVKDNFTWTINDDLSGLIRFNVSARGYTEEIPNTNK